METKPVTRVGVLGLGILLAACGGGGSDGSGGTTPPQNKLPVANAGIDAVVREGEAVSFDGGASSDPDGTIAGYTWSAPAGSGITLENADTAQSRFTAPDVGDTDAEIALTLEVTDNNGGKSADTVGVTVFHHVDGNTPPKPVVALVPETVPGELVTLSASGSLDEDADGRIIGYEWKQLTGPAVDLIPIRADGAEVVFQSPADIAQETRFLFRLFVTDDRNERNALDVPVVVKPAGDQPPVASAGVNQDVNADPNTVVTLDGSASRDEETAFEDLLFAWTQVVDGEDDIEVTLANVNSATPSFAPPTGITAEATLEFELTITDSAQQTATATASVTVKPLIEGNQLPVAVITGPEEPVAEDIVVTLDGSGSTDDGDIASFQWVQVGSTAGTHEVALMPEADNPAIVRFTTPVVGAETPLTFRLTVTDNQGAVASALIAVVVADANQAPVAEAEAIGIVGESGFVEVLEGATVLLNGAASDPDGDAFTFHWQAPEGITLSDPGVLTPSFTVPAVHADTPLAFTLTVEDGKGGVAADTVTIMVLHEDTVPEPFDFLSMQHLATGNEFETNEIIVGGINRPVTARIIGYSTGAITLVEFRKNGELASDRTTVEAGDRLIVTGLTTATRNAQSLLTLAIGEVTDDVLFTTTDGVTVRPNSFAGPDQDVTENRDAVLNGSASTDDGTITAFAWRQTAGIPVELAGAAAPTATFVAPDVEAAVQTLTFELTVTDNEGLADIDRVDVRVHPNVPPKANAGDNFTAYVDTDVVLNGSASSDNDGAVTSFSWRQVSGEPPVVLSDAETATAGFSAPAVDIDTTLGFELTVTDDQGAQHSDRVDILVRAASTPVAVIMSDIESISEGESFILSGADSDDPGGQGLAYEWTQVSGEPAGFPSGTTNESLEVIAPQVTESEPLVFSLVVTNEDNIASEPATKSITVVHVPDTTPDASSFQFEPLIAFVGEDNESGEVEPSGYDTTTDVSAVVATGSFTVDGLLIDGQPHPNPSVITSGQTLAVRLGPGDVGAQGKVAVTIGGVSTEFDVVYTDRPVADAGPDQEVLSGTGVALDGSLSHDADGIDEFAWVQIAGPHVVLTAADTATPSFDAPSGVPADEVLTFRLTVTDTIGGKAEDEVSVRVNDPPIAHAGEDQQQIDEGASVELDASLSEDSNGHELTYHWEQIVGDPVVLSDPQAIRPTFVAPRLLQGDSRSLAFQVTVDDGQVVAGSDSDVVVVTVHNTQPDVTLDFPSPVALTDAPADSVLTYRGRAFPPAGSAADNVAIAVNGNAAAYDPTTGAWTYDQRVPIDVQTLEVVAMADDTTSPTLTATLEHVADRRPVSFRVPADAYLNGAEHLGLSGDGGKLYMTTDVDVINEFDIDRGVMRAIQQNPGNTLSFDIVLGVDPGGDRIFLASRDTQGVTDAGGVGEMTIADGMTTLISRDFVHDNGVALGVPRDMIKTTGNFAYVLDAVGSDLADRRIVLADLATGSRFLFKENVPGDSVHRDESVNPPQIVIAGCSLSVTTASIGGVFSEVIPQSDDFCVTVIGGVASDSVVYAVNGGGGANGSPAISSINLANGTHSSLSDFSVRSLGPASPLSGGYRDVAYDPQRGVLYVLDYSGRTEDPWGVIMIDSLTGQRVMLFQMPGS